MSNQQFFSHVGTVSLVVVEPVLSNEDECMCLAQGHNSAPGENLTCDLEIKNPALYQLRVLPQADGRQKYHYNDKLLMLLIYEPRHEKTKFCIY